MELAASVILCLIAGWWLDGKLDTSPWLTVVGIIVGSGIGFRAVYAAAKVMQKQADEEDKKNE